VAIPEWSVAVAAPAELGNIGVFLVVSPSLFLVPVEDYPSFYHKATAALEQSVGTVAAPMESNVVVPAPALVAAATPPSIVSVVESNVVVPAPAFVAAATPWIVSVAGPPGLVHQLLDGLFDYSGGICPDPKFEKESQLQRIHGWLRSFLFQKKEC
jgi:hypothetical protein